METYRNCNRFVRLLPMSLPGYQEALTMALGRQGLKPTAQGTGMCLMWAGEQNAL